MLRSDLLIALRTLRKHRAYVFLNVAGLAVGLACCLMILLYVQDEVQFDRFHERADRIYRVTGDYTSDTGTRSFARTQPAVAPALLNEVVGVEEAVRFQRFQGPVRIREQVYQEDALLFADPSVFDVFTFPMLQGDAQTALQAPYQTVLTTSTATRYFGDANPIGQTITLSDTLHLQVTGIVADVPLQSHFQFDLLVSFATLELRRGDLTHTWRSGTYYTYALLKEGATATAVSAELPRMLERHLGDQRNEGTVYSLHLQPLTAIHLHSNLRQEFGPNGSDTNVTLFSIIALFILLVACVNFMNLATARSTRRAREVGVRKAMGAQRSQLIRQFLTEAVLLSLAALSLALLLVRATLSTFNNLTGKTLASSNLFEPAHLLTAVGLALLVGLLAGSYPAFYLSSFRPVAVLKGRITQGRGRSTALLRQSLVVFQFATSVFLITCTAVAIHQLDYMRNRPLGFDREQVLVLPFYWDGAVQERYETFKGALLQHASVRAVTASGDVPGRMFTEMGIWAEGMPETASQGMTALIVDPDFAETYGLSVVAGQDFSPELAADLGSSFVLNEAAVRALGWTPEEAVGKRFHMNTDGYVIGVLRDFHVEGLQHILEPLVMTVWPDWFGYISLRVDSDNVGATLAAVEATWRSIVPGRPFEAFFLDEDFDRQYRAEERFEQVFTVFAVLAIFIACLGLLGLVMFTAEQRTKEIGVRKVMGASVGGIVLLLSKEFTLLVGLAFLVATPAAYFAMQTWLDGFAYRVGLNPLTFLLAGAAALGIAWLTVSYQSVKAALANPVDALRYE